MQMTPAVIRRIVQDERRLRDAQARGLAGAGEDLGAARRSSATARCAASRSSRGNGGPVPRLRDGARRRRRHDRLLPSRTCWSTWCGCRAAGERERAHDLFDAHLPLLRYEQQPGVGLAVRKYVLMRARRDRRRCAAHAGKRAERAGARGGRLPARPTRAPSIRRAPSPDLVPDDHERHRPHAARRPPRRIALRQRHRPRR
ncbi:MAG: hypothetical protein MZW92_44515 [Comamonadaceae bacterium]|nr:hypothetical protein [Comamonadaceae bacterium]